MSTKASVVNASKFVDWDFLMDHQRMESPEVSVADNHSGSAYKVSKYKVEVHLAARVIRREGTESILRRLMAATTEIEQGRG